MAYCQTADVTLGNTEFPRGVNLQSVIDTQAEYIDSVLGRVYRLPLTLQAGDPTHKPYLTLLKLLNVYRATGTIILNSAGARQDNELNAYGKYYLNWADRQLALIEKRQIRFPDQRDADEAAEESLVLMVNKDTFSRVEEFYKPGQQLKPWEGTREVEYPWA